MSLWHTHILSEVNVFMTFTISNILLMFEATQKIFRFLFVFTSFGPSWDLSQ